MYQAEISRSQPTAYLFLVDQSGSMAEMMSNSSRSKAQFVADVLNNTLRSLVGRCTRDEGVRDYFSVGVVGYGDSGARNGLVGGLSNSWLNPISAVSNGTLRVEERQKMVDDGAGGLAPQPVKFPVWFDAVASGGTPMCDALAKASEVLADWCNTNPNSYPPTVIDSVLPNEHAKLLFRMSSLFPEHIRSYALDAHGINLVAESRAMVFNAEAEELVKFLDIGSRPAAMR